MGTGLIGGSFIMAARESFPDLIIHAVDPDEETLQYLLKTSIVDTVSRHRPTHFEPNHLVVLAAHLNTNLNLLHTLAPIVQESDDVLITDIGSCKQTLCDAADTLLPLHFVGGHPLAGKEFSGIQHATSLLFSGKPYAVCPPANYHKSPHVTLNVERLLQFIEVGLRAKVGLMDRHQHDKAMAYVSHFPQLYATLLTNLLAQNRPGDLLGFHGAGMDDQLRLAASPYAMWQHVFEQNKDNLLTVIQQSKALLEQAEAMLLNSPDPTHISKTDTTETMEHWFTRANTIHSEFQAFRHNDFPSPD